MKKYRLGYDYVFLAHDSFAYKNKIIGAMTVLVLFKVFDGNGDEILFTSNELDEQAFYVNEKLYRLSDLITCSFDENKLVHIKPNTPLLEEIKRVNNVTFSWKMVEYAKEVFVDRFNLEAEMIGKKEFFKIMKNNVNAFDNSDNKAAQTCSYFTEEV